MSKKIIIITLLTFILGCLLICCQKDNDKDSSYFNGDIRYFDDNSEIINVVSKSVSMDGTPTGMIAVYDSLLICWDPKFPNHFFNVFNVDTGEEIGSFCEKGQGPKESVSANCIYQLFKKGNDIMSLLYGNEGKLFYWNISQSVEKGETVYDTIVPYKNNQIFFLFRQSEDTVFAYRPADYLTMEEVLTPFYEKRTIYTNELIQDYPVYKVSSVRNADAMFFYTWDVAKPDGSKIVQAMKFLPQINIFDTHTGDIVGFRMKNGDNFSLLETGPDLKSMNIYYNCVTADDNYIYASYWGKEEWSDRIGTKLPSINTIHVFDWNGILRYKLITDRPFFRSIWLDQVRNRLYTMDVNTDELYYLDLDELNLKH